MISKFLRNFGTLAISDAISGAIGSIFWLYLASFLAVSNYGELQLLIGIAGVALGFSMFANNHTIIVYEVKERGLRGTLFLLSLIIATVVSIVSYLLISRLDVILLTFGMICGELLLGYFVGKKLFSKYGIFLVSQKVLMISLSLGLYFLIGVDGIIYGIGFSYIPSMILSFTFLKNSPFNFLILKENFGFIFNNYIVRLFTILRRNLDKILIVPILGLEILGEFALAFQVYLVMNLFASISFKFLLVDDSAGRNSNKFKIIILLISTTISIIGIILGPKIIPIFFPQFVNSVEIIPILSLAVIPNTIILIFSSKFLGNEKSKFILIGTIIYATSYLLLILLLGATYGIHGLAYTFLITSTGYAIYLICIYKNQIKN